MIGDECWRNAEGDHVGKAVVFRAKIGLGVREAGDASVKAVKHHRGENGERGGFKAILRGGEYRIKPSKEGGGGE